jgi:hypothetical protein
MTAVEIIKTAIKELSSPFDKDLVCFNHEELIRFVNRIAAAEREALANLCEATPYLITTLGGRSRAEVEGGLLAEAIRARSQL